MRAGSRVIFRRYLPADRSSIVELMDRFGDYLVALDTMRRERKRPQFGEHYTSRMLESVDRNDGVIYVAECEGRVVGFAAGVIIRQSEEDLLERVPSTAGRVIELFVEEQFRTQSIGTALMEKLEEYFRQCGCDVSKVEVFGPNVKAHQFYRKAGYHDRNYDMIKKL